MRTNKNKELLHRKNRVMCLVVVNTTRNVHAPVCMHAPIANRGIVPPHYGVVITVVAAGQVGGGAPLAHAERRL